MLFWQWPQSIKNGKYLAIKCMKNHFDSIEQVNNLREQAMEALPWLAGVCPLHVMATHRVASPSAAATGVACMVAAAAPGAVHRVLDCSAT